MRLVHGQTLRAAIADHHRAARPEGGANGGRHTAGRRRLLHALVTVGNAVAYAHARGVLHLDLKPENVLLGDFGEVVLLDWGLARLCGSRPVAGPDDPVDRVGHPDGTGVTLSGEAAGEGTTAGKVVGTLEYMAPEQAAGDAGRFDERTDVYGLGAMLYEILTGRAPRDYRGESVRTALARVLSDPVTVPREVDPDVPVALEALCIRAMAHDPAGRPPRAADFVRELECWLADEPVATYRAVVAGFERLAAGQPDAAGFQDQLARSRVTLGLILEGLGRPTDAAAAFEAAASDYQAVVAARPDSPAPLADLAATYTHRCRVLLALGRADEAGAARHEATAAYEMLTRLYPSARELHTGLASVLLTLMPGTAIAPRDAEVPMPPTGVGEPATTEVLPTGESGSVTHSLEPTTTESTALPMPRPGDARLTLREVIGRGGAASIFTGFDHELNREVAVKVQDRLMGDRPEARRRFLREAQITAQLEHPHVVPVYGLGYRSQDDAPFIMMRLIRGQTLSERIREYHDRRKRGEATRLELRRLISCLLDVCKALGYAHSRGVVHRDPKPTNILVGPFGEVMLADWGLAKLLGQAESTEERPGVVLGDDARLENTVEGAVIGTPAFMAPEHVRGHPELVGIHTDIYVLGGCLFMVLTGEPPNRGTTPHEIMTSLLAGTKPRSARALVADVDPALDAICSHALEPEPGDRYPSVRAMADDLERWLAALPVSVYRESVFRRAARRLRGTVFGRRDPALRETGRGRAD